MTVHLSYGFFMNGQGAGGIESVILAIGLALMVVINGGGALSLDRRLAEG